MPALDVTFLGVRLGNPLVLASGVLGTTKGSLLLCARHGAGAVTIKSLTQNPRPGHCNPKLVEVEHGFLNAVGYSNMGIKEALEEFKNLSEIGVPVFGSVVAPDAKTFGRLARQVSRLDFSALEIPLSCPHTPGLGLLAGQGTPEATREIISAVKRNTNLPVIAKLSPNVMNLGDVALSAVKAGADAINMGNTLGPGMKINIEARKPVLDFKAGGYSGPAVKPITIRCVYDVYAATKGKIPIIATGGITYGNDVIEAVMAGATLAGVGTAVYYRGMDAFRLIARETVEWMKKNKIARLSDIMGVAHG